MIEPLDAAPDRFELVGAEVHLRYPNGVHGLANLLKEP
jgi:hypothetical protein